MKRRRALIAAAFSVALVASAACGEEDTTTTPGAGATTSPSIAVDQALAAMVPEPIKSDGKIVVGTDATYAPNEFLDTDGSTVIGFDVDLFNAVAKKLGLTVTWTPAPFDSIITGVGSGRYEAGVSSFTVNPQREQQALMITYYSAGTQWGSKQGNPAGIDPNNACGKKVAVQAGTVQVDDATARSKKCTDAGQPAISLDQFQGQDEATNAVVSGKDEAMLADSPVIAYAVTKTNGQLQKLGEIYDSAPYGYVVKKDQTQFAATIRGAVAALIADGSYTRILKIWGVDDGGITDPQINP
jgi:polar amino acid transport system substrate-binding protein